MWGSLVNYNSYPVNNSCHNNMGEAVENNGDMEELKRRWRTNVGFSLCLTVMCWRQLPGDAKANEAFVVLEAGL